MSDEIKPNWQRIQEKANEKINLDYALNNYYYDVMSEKVYSKQGKQISGSIGKDAYLQTNIILNENNYRNSITIHKLVYILFHKKFPDIKTIDGERLVINHKDGNKQNNSISNLELIVASSNNKRIINDSQFPGAHRYKNKWKSELIFRNKKYNLGSFNSRLEATNAYQTKLKFLEKDYKNNPFNYPHNPKLNNRPMKDYEEYIKNNFTINPSNGAIKNKLTNNVYHSRIFEGDKLRLNLPNIYLTTNIKLDKNNSKKFRLHRIAYLLYHDSFPEDNLIIDHINGIKFDNSFNNLRSATHSQNGHNKVKSKNSLSQYKGVIYSINRNDKYQSIIKGNYNKIYIGEFNNEIDAGKAYDFFSVIFHGEYAQLNFPDEINNYKSFIETNNLNENSSISFLKRELIKFLYNKIIERGFYSSYKSKFETQVLIHSKRYCAGLYKTKDDAKLIYDIINLYFYGEEDIFLNYFEYRDIIISILLKVEIKDELTVKQKIKIIRKEVFPLVVKLKIG